MSLQRRIKRTTKQYIVVATICIIVMGGAAAATAVMITGQVKNSYSQLLSEARQELDANMRTVYIATVDIMAGDYVTEEDVESKQVYASQPPTTYMTSEDIGKVALIDILTGTQLLSAMLTDNSIASELREIEYIVINISSNIANNDIVDIRISFPNGEDYIILPKKTIMGVTVDTGTCYLWLTEEEILRMSSASVDAYLYEGAKLYVTKYIEPAIQDASKVTYEPSVSTLLLIQDNPNILQTATTELSQQIRKAMENRLADSFGVDVHDIDWELSPNDAKVKEELPAVLDASFTATYQEEIEEKEGELDYGP